MHRRPAFLAALLAFSSLLSCGREVTGPAGAGRLAEVQLNPVFGTVRLGGTGRTMSIGEVVDFERVRIVLVRNDGDTAVDRVIDFPPDSTSIRLAVNVTLGQAATSEGEPMQATLKYIDASGDTVFTGGPAQVLAQATSRPAPPPEIPVTYTGRGADAASIEISPIGFTGTIGQQVTFTAVVIDSSDNTMSQVPVAFTSTDSAIVRVDLRTGVATLSGARGSATIIAQTLTGQADSAPVTITPTASAILLQSGGGQSVRQGDAFPLPVRVRVNAVDGQPVAGVPVAFAVTRGQGSAAPAVDTTDASGLAEATWTAGDSAGVGNLTATVVGTSISVTASGTQLSSAPTSLTLETTPPNITAGDSLPSVVVVVRDATADTVSNFNGTVTLDLTGGTAGAQLIGTIVRSAVNGVATFPSLTVDRAGTAYRVRATVAGVPPVLSAAFNVAAAPPRFVTVVGGADQTAPASTALPDSVRVRVTNVFGEPIAGINVAWAVVTGGGSVVPANTTTNAAGEAATQWTIGATGAQQLSATVNALAPALVNASVFVGQGEPTLFAGVDAVSTTLLGRRSIPVFVVPASGAPVVASLTMVDTSIATWDSASVTFAAGATLRTPVLTGRGVGNTQAIISSSAGSDTVNVTVAAAEVRLSGNGFSGYLVGDTLRKTIHLGAPAPVGGLTVMVVSSDPSVLLVAPSSGRGAPSERCDNYYCSDDLMPGAGATGSILLAPPADTAFVTIKEGETSGNVTVIPVGLGTASVNVSAPNFAPSNVELTIEAPYVTLTGGITFGLPLAPGFRTYVDSYLSRPLTRDVAIRYVSRDTLVARVDSLRTLAPQTTYVGLIPVEGVGVGSTWIVVDASGLAQDSVPVTVVPGVTWTNARSIFLTTGENFTTSVSNAADSLGSYQASLDRITSLDLIATSSDTAVMKVTLTQPIGAGMAYGEVQIRAEAPGTAWLRVSAAGLAMDSVPVTVSAAVLSVYDASWRIGVGQIHQSSSLTFTTSGGDDGLTRRQVEVTASDTSIVTILDPTLDALSGYYFPTPRIVGRAAGVVTLTFAGAAFDTVTQTFTVVPPRLQFGGGVANGGTFDADSSLFGTLVYETDDFGTIRPAVDTVRMILRSTDPNVLQVVDSTIALSPGATFSFAGQLRLIGPGTARVVIEAPGHLPDTSGLFTLRPYRLVASVAAMTVGRGLRSAFGYFRRSLPGAPLPVTISTQGPAGITLRSVVDTFPAGIGFRELQFAAGAAVGTDTVIVSAAGHAPDTVFVVVQPSRARPSLLTTGIVGDESEVGALLDVVGGFGAREPSDTATLLLRTADTALVAIVADTIRLAPDGAGVSFQRARIRFRRPGRAWLRITDPSGLFATDSVAVDGFQRSLSSGTTVLDLGMRQRTGAGELYIYRPFSDPDSLWVRFTSSAPGVARTVEDSVVIEPGSNYAYYRVISGDSVGGAEIIASAPGYLDLAVDVGVSRGAITAYVGDITNGRSQWASAYVTSARDYTARETLEPVPLVLRSRDTSMLAIGADSAVTLQVGETEVYEALGPVTGTRVGSGMIAVEDPRTTDFRQYLPGFEEVQVRPARLQLNQHSLAAANNLTTEEAYVDLGFAEAGPRWIQVRSVGGRFSLEADSLEVPAFWSSRNIAITGITPGVDTLVISAPGFAPDTALVTISDGILRTYSLPASMQLGDSVLVSMSLMTVRGYGGTIAVTPVTVSFATSANVQVSPTQGAGPISTLELPPGPGDFQFWVRATATGIGELTVSAPGFTTARARFVINGSGN